MHKEEQLPFPFDVPEEKLSSSVCTAFLGLEHNYSRCVPITTFAFVENIVVYIAGFVVLRVSRIVSCNICHESLVSLPAPRQENVFHLIRLKNEGGLLVPAPGVVSILISAEKALRRCMNVNSSKRICTAQDVIYAVKTECGGTDFLNLHQHIVDSQSGIDNHYFDLIEVLVLKYHSLRMNHVARLHNIIQGCFSETETVKTCAFQRILMRHL